MFTIFVRTILTYLFLIAVMRLMGKRQIGELQLSELITALLLSEIAALPLTNSAIPLMHAIIPITALISLEIIITFIVTKSVALKRIFDGTPSLLIVKGKLDLKEMARLRLSIEELNGELRLKGYSDIGDIYYAILEQNGQLSVFPRAQASPVTPADIQRSASEKGIAHALIVDGKINVDNLRLASYSEEKLQKSLKKRALSPENVFLFTADDLGNETVIPKPCKKE